MEICVSRDLENEIIGERRQSGVDFYGNYEIGEELPAPAYRVGAMI
jgi:hypothetical protein